jgi:hypothetical protein
VIKRHDALKVDTRIWLEPRTLGCHRICYLRPSGRVRDLRAWPFVQIEVDGAIYRVHADNIITTNPAARAEQPKAPRRRPVLPDGFDETPLF